MADGKSKICFSKVSTVQECLYTIEMRDQPSKTPFHTGVDFQKHIFDFEKPADPLRI
jgi:hypothetical protein